MIPREQLNQRYFSFMDSYLNSANIAWGSNWKENCLLKLPNRQVKYL